MHLPIRRFRMFVDGVDKESDRFCKGYPDFVEVPSHIVTELGIHPNPEFETALYELGYLCLA